MGRRAILGNVGESSLHEVWNSGNAKDLLEEIFLCKSSPVEFICKTCGFGIFTKLKKLIKVVDNEFHRLLKIYI